MNTQTITVDNAAGEAVFFKLGFTTTFKEFESNLEWVATPECVKEMADEGYWVIL